METKGWGVPQDQKARPETGVGVGEKGKGEGGKKADETRDRKGYALLWAKGIYLNDQHKWVNFT